jgi:NADH-quinone oxidoreductase subunit J
VFGVEVTQLLFYLLSFVIIVSAIYVVTLRNIFHSALFLILALFGVAGIYILLEAEFLAAVQILIYVGAVAILMIFAIMLTSQLASKRIEQSNEQVTVAIVVCAGFLLVSLGSFIYTVWRTVDSQLPENNTLTIGKLLMTDFVLPFEVVSVVLLAAMIGAIVLARREKI